MTAVTTDLIACEPAEVYAFLLSKERSVDVLHFPPRDIRGSLTFVDVSFHRPIVMVGSYIRGDLFLDQVHFERGLDLSGLKISGKLWLRDVVLEDVLRLDDLSAPDVTLEKVTAPGVSARRLSIRTDLRVEQCNLAGSQSRYALDLAGLQLGADGWTSTGRISFRNLTAGAVRLTRCVIPYPHKQLYLEGCEIAELVTSEGNFMNFKDHYRLGRVVTEETSREW